MLRVKDVLKDKILITRESARLLEDALRSLVVGAEVSSELCDGITVAVDFEGVEGVAPSFLDELISVFESILGADSIGSTRRLIVANPPTRLSSKFEAVARGHGMSVRVQSDGSWLLTDAPNGPT